MARGDLIQRVSGAAGQVVGQAEVLAERAVPAADRDIIRRAMDLPFGKKLALARRLWRDPRMGMVARAPLVASLAYAVLPIKLTPLKLGPLRSVEKIVGLGVLLWLMLRLAPQDVVEQHLNALDKPGFWDRFKGKGKDE
jgi:hypothetical protein